ncbi:MAG: hypothetical protein HZA90_22305 [Verrucomicrobia bacterium]|nr:hypothetical protein [Verrucomicrobiota bacterium]
MQLILHQLKADLRHQRGWLAVFGLTLAVSPVLQSLSAPDRKLFVADFFLTLAQALLALLVTGRCVQADPLVGSTAFWRTRPLTRAQLFWSKTAFIVAMVELPFVLSRAAQQWQAGFSFHQLLLGGGESLLWATTFLFLGAALAAFTRTLMQFLARVGLLILGFVIWGVILEEVFRLRSVEPDFANHSLLLFSCRFVVAVGFLGSCAVVTWILQARWARSVLAVAALGIGVLCFQPLLVLWRTVFLNPPPPRLNTTARVELLPSDELPVTTQDSQLLYSHFRVTGLRSNEVAGPQHLKWRFQGSNGPALGSAEPGLGLPSEVGMLNHPQSADYLKLVQRGYSSDTLWFTGFHPRHQTSLPSQGNLPEAFRRAPMMGRFEAAVDLGFYEVVRLADLPLAPAAVTLRPGEQIFLHHVTPRTDGIEIDVRMNVAKLFLSRDPRYSVLGAMLRESAPTLLVLYHPGLREAYAFPCADRLLNVPYFLNTHYSFGGAHVAPYPALRAKLTGVPTESWLREARLHVYQSVYRSTAAYHLSSTNYSLVLDRGSQARPEVAEGRLAFRNASLATNAGDAEIEVYLDTVLDNAPDNFVEDDFAVLAKKFAALGPRGAPALVRRLPLGSRLEGTVRAALPKLITRDHLPVLQEALRRDPQLVWLFTAKAWHADAREIVLAQLRDRRQALPAGSLIVAAAAKDPATYPDLLWHFARLNHGHEQAAAALAQCPGLDLSAAVREAWKRARLGLADVRAVALPAAAEGLPEALATAIFKLEDLSDARALEQRRTRLAELTNSSKQGKELQDWLFANAERFQFEASTKRYTLAER